MVPKTQFATSFGKCRGLRTRTHSHMIRVAVGTVNVLEDQRDVGHHYLAIDVLFQVGSSVTVVVTYNSIKRC